MIDNKDHRLFMASLDVDSLFTNIPLNEIIDIVIQKVYGNKRKVDGLLKSDFKQLLKLSTQGAVFYFNRVYYRQKDGVAMGSPLGPALANAFLCHHEQYWLEDCPLAFYARYVDDIFVLLRSRDHVARLTDYLSSKHCNINHKFYIRNGGQGLSTILGRVNLSISSLHLFIEKTLFQVSLLITLLLCLKCTRKDLYQPCSIVRI